MRIEMTKFFTEGPDLSGKSTIATRLSDLTGFPIHHHGGRPKTPEELKNRILGLHDGIIYDRHPAISELIYSKVLNREPFFPHEWFIEKIMVSGSIIFYCNPGLEYLLTVREHLKKKEHKPQAHVDKVINNYVALYGAYEDLMIKIWRAGVRVYTFDFRQIDDKRIKGIISFNIK